LALVVAIGQQGAGLKAEIRLGLGDMRAKRREHVYRRRSRRRRRRVVGTRRRK
jgi:hypothetical protein